MHFRVFEYFIEFENETIRKTFQSERIKREKEITMLKIKKYYWRNRISRVLSKFFKKNGLISFYFAHTWHKQNNTYDILSQTKKEYTHTHMYTPVSRFSNEYLRRRRAFTPTSSSSLQRITNKTTKRKHSLLPSFFDRKKRKKKKKKIYFIQKQNIYIYIQGQYNTWFVMLTESAGIRSIILGHEPKNQVDESSVRPRSHHWTF